jgi:exopolysaccharide biosynthesis polyprenyl glycosylphosphotransferase
VEASRHIRAVGPAVAADPLEIIGDRTWALLRGGRRTRREAVVRRGLAAADLVGLTIAFVVATLIYSSTGPGSALGSAAEYAVFLLSLPVWTLVAKMHGLYDRDETRADHSTADDIVGVFHLVTVGTWVLLAGSDLSGLARPNVPKLITFWLLAMSVVPVARVAARELCRRGRAFQQKAVIVGAGDVGQLVARKLCMHPEYGIDVVGFVDRRPRQRRPDLPEDLTILGAPEDLDDIVTRLDIDRVVVSFSNDPTSDTLQLVRSLRRHRVHVDLVPRLFELIGPRVDMHAVEGLALLGLPPVRPAPASRAIKRLVDIAGASLGLLVAAPLLAYIAIRIRRDSPGPVLFRQTRLGMDMNEFSALKFRTMAVGTDDAAHREFIRATMSTSAAAGDNGLYKLQRADAVTPFGRWLRRTSLDELPQLINVLRGEMSLVGPRPCIAYETEYFEIHHFERFMVPQGLTGLWQVTARASSTFGEALDMDVAYVRGWSLWLDLRLLVRTPLAVMRQRRTTA